MKTLLIKALALMFMLFLQLNSKAQNDSVTICENSGTTTVYSEGVDSLLDLPPTIYSAPKDGTAMVAGRSITYTPNTNFTGKDSLSFVVCSLNPLVGCDTTKLVITILPSPTANPGPTQIMCYGDTISIGSAPVAGYTYQWTPTRGLSAYNISNPKASPTDTTLYTLTVTNASTGCKNSDTLLIIVKPVPSAYIIQGDTAHFCTGQPMDLTASNGSSFMWSNGDTTKTIVVTDTSIEYSVGVTYTNGCTDYSAPTKVQIDSVPGAHAGPDHTICLGDSVQLGTASVAHMSYSWAPSTGLNNDSIAQPYASPTVTTRYVLTVTDTLTGCSGTDTVIVTVLPQPVANAGPDKSICNGDSTVIGTPAVAGVHYHWVPATGLNSDTLAQPIANPTITTQYVVTASNGSCSNTDTVIVTVTPKPVANAGPNKTICVGDSAQIGTPGISGLTYSWAPAAGLSNDTIAQPYAAPAITTVYTVTVSNSTCTNTDSVTVIVDPPTGANAGPDKTICLGDSALLGTPGVSGMTYHWTPSTGLSSDSVARPYAAPIVTTTYILTATSTFCGGSTTDTVIVFVLPVPVANAGPDKTICSGDSTSIGSPAVSGITYSWSPAAGLSSPNVAQPNASPSATTTYILTASNGACSDKDTVVVNVLSQPVADAGPDKTICKGDSVRIGTTSVSGVTYSWSPATGLSSTTIAQPNAAPAVTTIYTVTVTNASCGSSVKDSVTVNVDSVPVANAGPNKTICKGDSTVIGTPAVAGITYTWSPSTGLSSASVAQPNASPSANTTYILTATNGVCSSTDTVVVRVNLSSQANAGPNKFICTGDSTLIGTTAVAGTTYNWSPSTGLNSDTIAQPEASPTVTTTYILTISSSACGTSSKDTVVVGVLPHPVANAGADKTICKGDSTTLGTASVAGTNYNWSPSAGLSSPATAEPVASPATSTVYTLTASNEGCASTDTVTLKVNPRPTAYVGNGQSTCGGGTVMLGGAPVAGDVYVWSPSAGLSSITSSQPTANPTSTTTYTLVETDTATGCSMTNQVEVTFGSAAIYTAISPNGDGINDWWYIPVLSCYPNNTVCIVNRWGSEVWKATGYDNSTVKWDGKDMDGIELPDGTYFYSIIYNNTEKRGWILVKR